jgi:hypothetical protein
MTTAPSRAWPGGSVTIQVTRSPVVDPNTAQYSVSFQSTVVTGFVLLGRVHGVNALRDLLRKLQVTEPMVDAACDAVIQRSVYEISNVTLTPTTAQKQNLGETRVRGVQTDVEYHIGSFWRVTGAYVYDQAKVTDGGVANRALVGKYVPQVPLHRGSFQVAYSNPRYATVAFSMQALSLQYNDDQNVQFIPAATLAQAGYASFSGPGLPGYASYDLTLLRDSITGKHGKEIGGIFDVVGAEGAGVRSRVCEIAFLNDFHGRSSILLRAIQRSVGGVQSSCPLGSVVGG